jgi:hypothetical protein
MADDEPGQKPDTVSREEFEELRDAYKALQRAFEESLAQPGFDAPVPAHGALWQDFGSSTPGSRRQHRDRQRFVVTGFGTAGFTDSDGADSNFAAGVFPVFLWRLNERILFETELHISEGGESDGVELSYAQASYIANDWLTLGAGKFLSPFGAFQERIHPSWINKLPSSPIVFGHDGSLAPEAMLGAQARGAVALGDGGAKMNYAVWVANGPGLVDADLTASAAGDEPDDDHAKFASTGQDGGADGAITGRLDFDTGADGNNNKSAGTRVGFLPVPWIEIGGSYWSGQAGPSDSHFRDVDFRLLGLDFVAQMRELKELPGTLELRGEWIWSDVDDDYLPYENRRDGGYAQLAYRPALEGAGTMLNDFEGVLRYDRVNVPSGAPADDTDSWTFGINYWLSAASVLKAAVETRHVRGRANDTTLLLQWALGF